MIFVNRQVNIVTFGGILILLSIFFVVSDSLPKADPLYNENDDVMSLNNDNFDYTVLATSNAWLVEFYNSWCGHCIRYAPFYKRLATSVKGWSPFLKVAAVDCAAEFNRDLCQFFDVHMYPTLKFLPAFASKRQNGTACPAYDVLATLKGAIVEYVSNSSLSNIGGRRLSLMQPVEDFGDIWQPLRHGYGTTVVIFEEEQSVLGRQVILDTFGEMSLTVRRIEARDAPKYGVFRVPSMFLVDNTNGSLRLLAEGDNGTNYVTIIKNLTSASQPTHSNPSQVTIKGLESVGNPTNIHEIDADAKYGLNKSKEAHKKNTTRARLKGLDLLSDNYLKVHEQDLESSLHYSLRHEIAMFKTISDEALIALKKYINALAKFLPVQKPISRFLNKVNNWLHNQSGPITGDAWLEAVNRVQSSTEILPESTVWTGCQGSKSKYRGYPCSLWTTFHTLTVAAFDRNAENDEEEEEKEEIHSSDVMEALLAIRGYVKFFFGCRECSENFLKRSIHIEELVRSAKSGVLFLWRSHNRANHFLSSDLTEDPAHPKVQFPTSAQCSSCHAARGRDGSDVFNENEVLVFLQNMYSRRNLIPDSPRLEAEMPKRDDVDVDASIQRAHKREDLGFHSLYQNEKLAENPETYRTRPKVFTLTGLGAIDIGLCVIFYVFCLAFVIIVYLRFFKHRSYRMFGGNCKLPV